MSVLALINTSSPAGDYDTEVLNLFLARLGGLGRHFWPAHQFESRFSCFTCTAAFTPFHGTCFSLLFDGAHSWQAAINRLLNAQASLAAGRLEITSPQPLSLTIKSRWNSRASTQMVGSLLAAICSLYTFAMPGASPRDEAGEARN